MKRNVIDKERFMEHLIENEKAPTTINKYIKDLDMYGRWITEAGISSPFADSKTAKMTAIKYKEYLKNSDLKSNSINNKLAAVNSYMESLGYTDKVKYIKVQKNHFYSKERELSLEEYSKLVDSARAKGNERLALIIETLASTGIRISELQFVTIEGLMNRKIYVHLKGKSRVVYLPNDLCTKLHKYVKKNRIKRGPIFITSSKVPISRRQIWREMKGAADRAHIEYSKVFPHNMRHVFAKAYYDRYHDLSTLADILGHSSLETTRIYLANTFESAEHQIDTLGLVR